MAKRKRRYTMICGGCEHEWDAEQGDRRVCPKCGCDDEFETHVIRDESAVDPAIRAECDAPLW